MRDFELKVGGLSCGSCERTVERAVRNAAGEVKSFDFQRGIVRLSGDENALARIISYLNERGFHAREWTGADFSAESPLAVISALFSGNGRFRFERELALASAIALMASLAASLLFVSFLVPAEERNFFPLTVLGSFGVAMGLGALSHIRPYGRQTCQTGMMLGMGVGMILGFLSGALFGAVNGMFVGSVLGMGTGMLLGAWIGYCCGAMGILEGLMAGLMSGTMGAMLSVMLYNDHQLEFLAILWAVCAVILLLLSYMLFKENGPAPASASVNPWIFLVLSVLLTLYIDFMLVFGPRSPLAWGA